MNETEKKLYSNRKNIRPEVLWRNRNKARVAGV